MNLLRRMLLGGGCVCVGVLPADQVKAVADAYAATSFGQVFPGEAEGCYHVRTGSGRVVFVPWTANTPQGVLWANGVPCITAEDTRGVSPAAEAVYAWSLDPERTWGELHAAYAYLCRWPNGPRLELGCVRAAKLLGITRETLSQRVAKGTCRGRQTDIGVLIPWPEVVRMRDEPPRRGRARKEEGQG